jgi:hypothetical protein
MRKHAMIAVVALVTAGGCADGDKNPAAGEPGAQPPAQAGDDQKEARDVAEPMTFEVSKRGQGTAVLEMTIPEGWAENQRLRIGKGWQAPDADDVWLTVELDCGGTCDPAAIPGNVQPIVEAKQAGDPRTGPSQPSKETAPVEQEVIEDSPLDGGHLIARRFTPPKEVMDPPKPMLEVFCYRHDEGMPVYVAITGKGPVEEAGAFEDVMIHACRSLEIVEWKAEE